MTRLSLSLLSASAIACTEPGRVLVETSADQYILQGGSAAVTYEVTNNSTSTVGVSRCGDQINPAVERLENGAWVNVDAAMCIAVLPMVPLELAPGATVTAVKFVGAAGTLRLRLGVSQGQQEPQWTHVSNRFIVQ